VRLLQVVGVGLIVGGAALLWKHPTWRTRKDVVTIGDLKASVEQQAGIPLWIGAAAVGGGVVLLLAASRRSGNP